MMATVTPAVMTNVRSSRRAGAFNNLGCDIRPLEAGGCEMFNVADNLFHFFLTAGRMTWQIAHAAGPAGSGAAAIWRRDVSMRM